MIEIVCKYRVAYCPMLNDLIDAYSDLNGEIHCNEDYCPRGKYQPASDQVCESMDYINKEFCATVKSYEFEEDPYGDGYLKVGKRKIDIRFIDYLKIGDDVKIVEEVE